MIISPPAQINRLGVGNLTIQMQARMLVIFRRDRSDLPHLTISFNNPSGEIDFHLAVRKAENQPEYLPVARIKESEIANILLSLIPKLWEGFIQNIQPSRRVRPGWLGRKGYLICHISDNSRRELLDKILPIRKKSKKWERFISSLGFVENINPEQVEKYFYSTSILQKLRFSEQNLPIFAVRVRGKHKPAIIPLVLLPYIDGKRYWYRGDLLIKIMKDFGEDSFDIVKKLFPDDAWEKIFYGLQLQEFRLDDPLSLS